MSYSLDDIGSYHSFSVKSGSGSRIKRLVDKFYTYNIEAEGFDSIEPVFT